MRMQFLLSVCTVILPLAVVFAEEPTGRRALLPADLAAIPGDGIAFAHLQLTAISKDPAFEQVRDSFESVANLSRGGSKARMDPLPAQFERMTLVVIPNPDDILNKPVKAFFILATKEAIDRDDFLKSKIQVVEKKAKNGIYYLFDNSDMAVTFINDRVLAFGTDTAIALYLSRTWKADGPLSSALQAANGNRPLVAGTNLRLLREALFAKSPETVQTLFRADLFTESVVGGEKPNYEGQLTYPNVDLAAAAYRTREGKESREALRGVLRELTQRLDAPLGKMPDFDTLLILGKSVIERADLFAGGRETTRDGSNWKLVIDLPTREKPIGVGVVTPGSLLVPRLRKVGEATAAPSRAGKLHEIGKGIHAYYEVKGRLPAAAICDVKGKPLLSWRVAILPYIKQEALYKEFKLDEPWDSEHNKKLISRMPAIFAIQTKGEEGVSHYRVFHGPQALFDLKQGRGFEHVTDGTSNTVMVVEADQGVVWTKPDDFVYDARLPLPKFSTLSPTGFNVLFADGSVRYVRHSTKEVILRAMITTNGGEVFELP